MVCLPDDGHPLNNVVDPDQTATIKSNRQLISKQKDLGSQLLIGHNLWFGITD